MNQKRFFLLLPSVVVGVLAVVSLVSASTTISTSITTAGTLTVTGSGVSAFTGNLGIASTTPGYPLSVEGSGYFGDTIYASKLVATSTIAVAGAASFTSTITNTTSGTTTLTMVSGGNTGLCLKFYATSSATQVNMTFSATTTALTNNTTAAGIIPVIKYGACN